MSWIMSRIRPKLRVLIGKMAGSKVVGSDANGNIFIELNTYSMGLYHTIINSRWKWKKKERNGAQS